MAEFLTTNRTSSHIEDIIIDSKKELFLVSPYLQLSKTFFERIKDAHDRGVKIRIVYGKDELKPNEKSSIEQLINIELYYFENLHAKCYFNENDMVITSMNMYEFSMTTNREMGVHINREEDGDLYRKAVAETKSIISSAEQIVLSKTQRSLVKKQEGLDNKLNHKKNTPSRGYCLRCQERIPFDPAKPLCRDCFGIWVQYGDPFYLENNCHGCGVYGPSSVSQPLCDDCYDSF